MNHSYYESRSKEKLNDLMKEGMMSQAYSRSRSSKTNLLSKLPKFIIFILGALGLIQIILR
jgi:hypothetical protein